MLVAVGDFAMPVAPSHGPGWSVAAPCPWRPAPIQARAPGLRTGAPSGCGLLRRGVLDTHGAQRPLQDDREVAAEPHPLRVVGPDPELEVGGRLTESHEQRLRRRIAAHSRVTAGEVWWPGDDPFGIGGLRAP